jgi:hypothetical protein
MREELLKLASLLKEAGAEEEANKVMAASKSFEDEFAEAVKKKGPFVEKSLDSTIKQLEEEPFSISNDPGPLDADLTFEEKPDEEMLKEYETTLRAEMDKFIKDPSAENTRVVFGVMTMYRSIHSGSSEIKPLFASAKLQDALKTLASVADELDSIGLKAEADSVDELIQKTAEDVLKWQKEDKSTEQSKRYDSKHHHSLQVREPKREQERTDLEGRKEHHVSTYQQTNATALSTRYCPEHVGVSLARVGEATYQCGLDGKVYNWEAGWTDYQGNKHPGGSVAGQTPDSAGYAPAHRMFDTRK